MRPLGEWAPDVADLNTDTLDVARNVVPGVNSYLPALDLLAQSIDALPTACRGLWYVQKTNGNYDTYCATATKLYKYNADTMGFDDVSRLVGGNYNLPSDDYWSGTQFGNRLIVCQWGDVPQFIDVDSGTNFALLPNAPTARFVNVMDDKVVFVSISGNPDQIKWSDINDSEEYTNGLAGNQEFPDHGAVMGFFPHARIVLLERGMRAIVSTGDIYSFNFPELTSQKGTVSPWSVIEFGTVIYWLSEDGFYVGNADAQKNISEKRISSYFFDSLNRERIFQVLGAFDPHNSRVLWTYATGDTEYNDRILVYDWSLDRWSELAVPTYFMSRLATAAVSLDGGSDSTDMDGAGLSSLDSRIYMAGAPVLIAVGTDLKLSTFAGDVLEWTIKTGTYQFGGGRRVRMRNVLTFIEGEEAENVTLKVMKKQRMSDAWNTSGAITQQVSGLYRMNADGMFHSFEFTGPAGITFNHAQGWEPNFVPTSER